MEALSDLAGSLVGAPSLRTLAIHSNTHVLVLGLIFAAADAYGIGSNDVANAFATSVGSGSLTLMAACIIAVFTEFIGAITLGADVTDTIKSGILDIHAFDGQSDTLALAMLCALIGSSLWVNSATRLGMPVSTTHSIVGATVGVGMAFGGVDAVDWGHCSGSTCGGVLGIVVSWFMSPALAACFSAALFLFTKHLVLRAADPFRRALCFYPFYIFVTWTIVAFFLLLKGAPALNESYAIYEKDAQGRKHILRDRVGVVMGFAFVVGGFMAALAFLLTLTKGFKTYCLRSRETGSLGAFGTSHVNLGSFMPSSTPLQDAAPNTVQSCIQIDAEHGNEKEEKPDNATPTLPVPSSTSTSDSAAAASKKKASWQGMVEYAASGMTKDILTITDDNIGAKMAAEAHERGERFDPATERVFSAVQVFTASFASLAHGANDVSNAVAPLCTIFWVWRTGGVSLAARVPVETWILAFGGVFIDLGLSLSGWRIMRSLGNNITFHSPSRGFAMELGALTTVLYASQQGKPVSTTHCITGATVGVGLCGGDLRCVNWLMVAWALCGWMLTLPCAGLVAAALFGLIAQSPKALPPSQTHVYPLELAAPVPPLADTALQALQGASQGVCVVQTHCNPVS